MNHNEEPGRMTRFHVLEVAAPVAAAAAQGDGGGDGYGDARVR
jgi:hypothetical protein